MSAEPAVKLTPQAYLAMERQQEYKSEYINGDIFAMAGASRWHNLIVTNSVAELRAQLKGRPCELYANDMRVWIPRIRKYTYPDLVVVCGNPQFEDEERDTLLNPTLIIEVLSPSTAAYDRGDKFKHYRTIESLREYVLISQTRPWIERYVRQESTPFWMFSDAEGLEAQIELDSIGCTLALTQVYEKVKFEEERLQ